MLLKSRQKLEEKAQLYDALRKGDTSLTKQKLIKDSLCLNIDELQKESEAQTSSSSSTSFSEPAPLAENATGETVGVKQSGLSTSEQLRKRLKTLREKKKQT